MKILRVELFYKDKKRYFMKTGENRLPYKGEFFLYKGEIWPAQDDFAFAKEDIYKEIIIKIKRK